MEMTDAAAFTAALKAQRLFEPGTEIIIARAPGRLDVMGGIADYSGSLVLQWPIAEATFAAVQATRQPLIEILSVGEPVRTCTLRLDDIAMSYDEARSLF